MKVAEEKTKNGTTKIYKEIPINNPFVRGNNIWDSENVLFDKVKVSLSDEIVQVFVKFCVRGYFYVMRLNNFEIFNTIFSLNHTIDEM